MTTYQKYRAQGLCARCCRVRCASSYCQACRDERASRRKLSYLAKVASGICPQCGRRHDGATVHCRDCAQREKERAVLGTAGAA